MFKQVNFWKAYLNTYIKNLKKHAHFKISSRDKHLSVYTSFFFFSSSRVEISSLSFCAFTCNRNEISSRDETCPWMKNFLFTREFHPGMKRVEFPPGMKFNLKENLPLSLMKTYNKISHFFSIIEIRSLIC